MKSFLTFILIIAVYDCFSQVTNHQVEPVGIYKKIDLSKDTRIIQVLLDTNSNLPNTLIDSIEQQPNRYIPPVLYVLSHVLFREKRISEACFWFYLAQLRARYDVNRCTDKTANASEYNDAFGPDINIYAFHHLDNLAVVMKKVIAFEKVNEESYDQRWINLTGMDAMTASLSNEPPKRPLSVNKKEWPAIKIKTIEDFYNGYLEGLEYLKKHKLN